MNYLLCLVLVVAALALLIMQGRASQRKNFLAKKAVYKRPIWNVLNRQSEPFSCAQINHELAKIKALSEIADVELMLILGEMVSENILRSVVVEKVIGDPPIKIQVTKYSVTHGSEPPAPPREDPEPEAKKGPQELAIP